METRLLYDVIKLVYHEVHEDHEGLPNLISLCVLRALCGDNLPWTLCPSEFRDGFRAVVFAQSPSPDWAKGKFSAHSAPLRLLANHSPRRRSGYRDQRALVMEMMYRYSEVNQREIGQVMGGVDYTSVSRERKILRERIHKDTELKKWSREIENTLLP